MMGPDSLHYALIGLSATLAVISITFMSLAPALLSSTRASEEARQKKSLFRKWLAEKRKRHSTNKEINQNKVLKKFYTDSIQKDEVELKKLSLPSIRYVRLGFISFCSFVFSAIWIVFGKMFSTILISAQDELLHTSFYFISLLVGFIFLFVFSRSYWFHVKFISKIDERRRYVDKDVQIMTTLEVYRDGKWIDILVLNCRIKPNENMRAKVKFEGNIANGFYDLRIRKESYGGEETWIPDPKTWLGKFGARINEKYVFYDEPDLNTGVIRGKYLFSETESYWDFNFPFSWGHYIIDIGVFDDPYLLPAEERRRFTNTHKIIVFPEYQRYLKTLENEEDKNIHHSAAKKIRDEITYNIDVGTIDETPLIEGILKYLREKYDKVEDDEIRDTVRVLISSLENIFRHNQLKPEKQEKLGKIFDDLLPNIEYWLLNLDKENQIRKDLIEILGVSVEDKSFELLMNLIKESEFDVTLYQSYLMPAVKRRIMHNRERISSIKEMVRTLPREDKRYEYLKAILDEYL